MAISTVHRGFDIGKSATTEHIVQARVPFGDALWAESHIGLDARAS